MREEIVGVGLHITVGEFFARNPAFVGLGGQVRTAVAPDADKGPAASTGAGGQGIMLWGGRGCEEREPDGDGKRTGHGHFGLLESASSRR